MFATDHALDWAGDRLVLAELLRYMHDHGDTTGWTALDAAYFLETPYKWQREYERMLRDRKAAA